MTRDARYDRTARLADREDRVAALERLNVLRGIAKAQTRQAKAIDFLAEHLTLFEEMIEKYKAKA
jgi:hypothetical protein